jgi:hypothetical protein
MFSFVKFISCFFGVRKAPIVKRLLTKDVDDL